jgi:hypothetical protein
MNQRSIIGVLGMALFAFLIVMGTSAQAQEAGRAWAIKSGVGGIFTGHITGEAGVFTRVACAGKGTELHVCGVNTAGQLLHTIRYGNSTWQNFFGDIGAQVCRSGKFQNIACGVDGNDVHVCAIT